MRFRRKKTSEQQGRNPNTTGGKAPVFSYYSSRNVDETSAVGREAPGAKPAKNRPWWLIYLPSLIALAVVVVASLYITTLTTKPRIEIATTDSNRPLAVKDTDAYEQAAQKVLAGSIFNRSKLTINTDAVAKKLEEQFPELGDIVVTVPLIGRRPIIQTQPATPALIVAGDGGTFIVDDKGRPIIRADEVVSSIRDNLPLVTDNSGSNIQIGKQLLPTDLVKFIVQIDDQFKAQKLAINSYTLPALANELHATPKDATYYVKFNTDLGAREQVGTYLAVSEKLKTDGVTPSEYIDVRVSERAYYR